jgi:hypothetical protein
MSESVASGASATGATGTTAATPIVVVTKPATPPKEDKHILRTVLGVIAILLLIGAIIAISVVCCSGGGSSLPNASTLVGQNMTIRAVSNAASTGTGTGTSSTTNYLTSVIVTQPPILGPNIGNVVWVIQNSPAQNSGFLMFKNVNQGLYLTADIPANNNAVYMALKNPAVDDMALQCFTVETVGSQGYRLKSSSNTYINAGVVPISSNATQSTATIFSFSTLLL